MGTWLELSISLVGDAISQGRDEWVEGDWKWIREWRGVNEFFWPIDQVKDRDRFNKVWVQRRDH